MGSNAVSIALLALAVLIGLALPSSATAPKPTTRPGAPAAAAAPKTTAPAPPSAAVSPGDDAAEAKAHEDAEPGSEGEATLPPTETRPTLARPLGSAGLDLALTLIAKGDYAGATLAAYALPNRVDIKIVDWLVATSGSP